MRGTEQGRGTEEIDERFEKNEGGGEGRRKMRGREEEERDGRERRGGDGWRKMRGREEEEMDEGR